MSNNRGGGEIVSGKKLREEEEFQERKKELSSFIMLTYSHIKLFLATFLVNIAKEFLESNQTRNPNIAPKSS